MKTKRHETRKAKQTSEDGNVKNATYVVHGVAPAYDFLKDNTGILTPEVSDGPYVYPESQLLRQDVVEHQVGIPLELNIGVMDITTCAPVRDVLVNIWVSLPKRRC
jgi:protocatechuate 3,4-dioxygenase beta subunit